MTYESGKYGHFKAAMEYRPIAFFEAFLLASA